MTMTPLYLSADIRRLEKSQDGGTLMARAGLALATLAEEIAGDTTDPMLIIAGPGNNGGDALVAARHLKQKWNRVLLVLAADAGTLPPEAAAAYRDWVSAGGSVLDDIPDNTHFCLAIDGLFGIGLKRPPQGRYAALISRLNELRCPILAVDIPSGLDADTGNILGAAVEADYTLTFLAAKPGLYTMDGPDHAGTVLVSDLGVDATASIPPQGWLLERVFGLPPRKQNAHKGLFGNVAVIGGSEGMAGAALLAARSALLSGAGRVYVGLLAESAPLLDPLQPELMLRRAANLHETIKASCAVLGPGLGQSPQALEVLRAWLTQATPAVLDADALQLIGKNPALHAVLKTRQHASIITPHPGEAAALLACTGAEIQLDRVNSALRLAQELNVITVLKGAGTVIAEPSGHWYINSTGNPGLSSAGTGDVLAGILGSLIAQGLEASHAAKLAVHLHGAAADALVARGIGPVGLTASEVALEVRQLINQHSNQIEQQ
jgi:hydroxyethylthiazole kinase-like uncharacterized protein yjeF